MIKIIAHRGLWNHEEEQNANVAILRARDNKLGSEIDLYSLNQTIYCAHDMSKIHNNTLTYSLLDKELRDFDYFLDIKSLCMAKELKNIILDKKNKFLINVADDELKEYQDFGFSVYHSHNLSNSVTLPCVKHGLLADFWGSTKNYHKFIDTMKTYV